MSENAKKAKHLHYYSAFSEVAGEDKDLSLAEQYKRYLAKQSSALRGIEKSDKRMAKSARRLLDVRMAD